MNNMRTELAKRALLKATELRDRFDVPLHAAVNVFDLCADRLEPAITVRFMGISMEGVYLRDEREIWLGLRPLVRRVFNCAHELGHCVFGHGSTLDELQVEGAFAQPFNPNEWLANNFAAYLLMPRLAVCRAFSIRGWKAEEATPESCFIVACSLGVGYETLANHLVHSLRLVCGSGAEELLKTRLPKIRRGMLGDQTSDRLLVIDQYHTLGVVDTEVGTGVLLPAGTKVESENLAVVADTARGRLYRAVKPGITRVYAAHNKWAVVVRIMRDQYVGLSRYRHLEIEDGDDE